MGIEERVTVTVIVNLYKYVEHDCILVSHIVISVNFRLEFVLSNGDLKHTKSGKCVQPIGAVTDGVTLGLFSTCEGHQFSFTTGGSLQHVGSKKCVNTKSGVSKWRHLQKCTIQEEESVFVTI